MRTTIFLALIFSSVFAAAQIPVVFVNAGSRAGTGNIQELTINSDGSATFCERDIKAACKSPTRFTITPEQLDSIYAKAIAIGFFSLKEKYETNVGDGSGVYVSIRNLSKALHKRVSVINNTEPTVNEFVTWLNSFLASYRVRIYYAADKLKKQ